MSADNTGGPAFPAPELGFRDFGDHGAYAGMTLRDYFAAKAMAALIAEPPFGEGSRSAVAVWDDRDEKSLGPEQFAHVAYLMADSMLKAREA